MSVDEEPIGEAREPTEEELRAAYEAQVKRLRVEHVVMETVVTLANLGMRRTGLAPGTEDERDPDQVRMAIDSIRGLMPVVEQTAPDQVGAIRDAVSQLQLAFVRIGGQETPPPGPAGDSEPRATASGASPGGGRPSGGSSERAAGEAPGGSPGGDPARSTEPDGPGPAQRSGRLWIPGQ